MYGHPDPLAVKSDRSTDWSDAFRHIVQTRTFGDLTHIESTPIVANFKRQHIL